MKRKIHPLFLLYQLLVAYPLVLMLTLIVALATIVLFPLFPGHPISYFPARWWGRAVCFLFFVKVEIEGLDRVDPKRSYVILANHQSVFDIFVIYGWLPNLFKWIMKAELRRIPFVGKACEAAGHIFLNRANPVATLHSIEKAERQLINGLSVVIFPEGTRTHTGNIGTFKKGAFYIAADLNLPILPVSISGAFERMPRSSFLIKPGTIRLCFHAAINVSGYLPDSTSELLKHTHDLIASELS